MPDMPDPVRAEMERLAVLSAKATPGLLTAMKDPRGRLVHVETALLDDESQEPGLPVCSIPTKRLADAEFIVALVNAYRAGHLALAAPGAVTEEIEKAIEACAIPRSDWRFRKLALAFLSQANARPVGQGGDAPLKLRTTDKEREHRRKFRGWENNSQQAWDDLDDVLAALSTIRPAHPQGGTMLTDACKPWQYHTGEPPSDESPLAGVFGAGMAYTERLLARHLGVDRYEGGDGSEDFDQDATKTLENILAAAGLYDPESGRWAALAHPQGGTFAEGVEAALEVVDEEAATHATEDGEIYILAKVRQGLQALAPSASPVAEEAWRPIEMAPRSRIIWLQVASWPMLGHWSDQHERWYLINGNGYPAIQDVTGWREAQPSPLRATPPADTEQADQGRSA